MPNTSGKGGFKRGESGNKRGRPPNSSPAAEWRAALGEDLDKIISKVRKLALAGDLVACRLVLDRTLPALKPVDQNTPLAIPTAGSLTARSLALFQAMVDGVISPQSAASMIGALAGLVRAAESEDIFARLDAIEANQRNEADQ